MNKWKFMKNKDLKEKPKSMELDQLFNWLTLIFATATSITVMVFGFYFMNFNSELSTDQNIWGVFGDFIGGTLNPILSFLALIALLLTVVLQSKQLELSRRELQETKEAMQESAKAQQKMQIAQAKQAKAMEISARMTAITKLLEQNEEALKDLNLHKTESAATIGKKIKPFDDKKEQLRQDLDDLYTELIKMHQSS